MRKKYNRDLISKWKLGLIGLMVICFAGCGSGSSDTAAVMPEEGSGAYSSEGYVSNDIYERDYATEEPKDAAAAEVEGEPDAGAEASVASNRKLIKTVNLDVETEAFDELVPKVENKVSELGGYIESLNVYNGSSIYGHSSRYANLTIRIPKDKMDNFVTAVSDISNVTSRSENTQDITLQYVDVESHKKALEVEQERLLDLLEAAENMEDIVAIEQRLSEVRYQLQNMESQLRTYDNLVDYSTVYLNISEVEVLTPTLELSAWEKISVGFLNSINNVGKGIKNFFIYLIIWLPYIVVWSAIILFIVVFVKFLVKKRLKKTGKSSGQGGKDRYGNSGEVKDAQGTETGNEKEK
ncbi:MAG: DUF4349 domain-containing protein [Clostridiales bacterium]|nr:DUF4349 domain-containing protein [Clostridiales bacterium]